MQRVNCIASIVLLLLVRSAVAADPPALLDVRRGVPSDAFMAVYAKHNPERDFQRKYYDEVWKSVQETQIVERAIKIATDRATEEDLDKAKAVLQELREAAAPIDVEAILQCKAFAYAQFMRLPTAQHLALMQLTPESAASTEEGVKNLFALLEKYTQGEATVQSSQEGEAKITTLSFGQADVPFSPTIARANDVLVLSTSADMASQSLKMLVGGEGESKFDDPRLAAALRHLPEPEDSLVFFDGRTLFDNMRGFGQFIRAASNGNPEAERVAGMIELVIDDIAVFDYEVAVEYTEGNLNRSAAFGQLQADAEKKTLTKMLASGQPFEQWQTWVPADALSYSLTTGANLHPLYERIVAIVKEDFPEVQQQLDEFEAMQAEIGIHLDRDILQAFSGETVSISLPPATPSLFGSPDTFTAIRCQKPERIRELLHRLVESLQQIPAVQLQQLELSDAEELEGFEQLSATALASFGVRPVIGFRDGWMIIGSNAAVVQKVFDTRAGQGATIDQTAEFRQFQLEIAGPVRSLRYTNLAESTRGITRLMNQAGLMAPMIVGLAGANMDAEELKPVQELLALLPDVAKIVAKFDFLEAKISVTQAGDEPGSYITRKVTRVRPEAPNELKIEAELR